jgi:hypothetical protein
MSGSPGAPGRVSRCARAHARRSWRQNGRKMDLSGRTGLHARGVAPALQSRETRGSTLRNFRREFDAAPRSSGRFTASGAHRRLLRLLASPLGSSLLRLFASSLLPSPRSASPLRLARLRRSFRVVCIGSSLRSGLCPSVRAPWLRFALRSSGRSRRRARFVSPAWFARLGSLRRPCAPRRVAGSAALPLLTPRGRDVSSRA